MVNNVCCPSPLTYEYNCQEATRLVGDVDDKYVLGLSLRLYYPYDVKCISATVVLLTNDDTDIVSLPVFVNTPFSNKHVYCAQMEFGKKHSKSFIPLTFDTFDNLTRIQKIEVAWRIETEAQTEYVCLEYDIKFDSTVKHHFYTFMSYDMCAADMVDMDEYLNRSKLQLRLKDDDSGLKMDRLGAVYGDVYILCLYDGMLMLKHEDHAKDSTYSIDIFDDDSVDPLPFCLKVPVFRCLADEMASGECFSVTIAYCHGKATLNDNEALV